MSDSGRHLCRFMVRTIDTSLDFTEGIGESGHRDFFSSSESISTTSISMSRGFAAMSIFLETRTEEAASSLYGKIRFGSRRAWVYFRFDSHSYLYSNSTPESSTSSETGGSNPRAVWRDLVWGLSFFFEDIYSCSLVRFILTLSFDIFRRMMSRGSSDSPSLPLTSFPYAGLSLGYLDNYCNKNQHSLTSNSCVHQPLLLSTRSFQFRKCFHF
jgi:hypothetical protein